ncbi:MAG: glycine cleavage system protein H [Thermoplasmatota archaeon]
MRFPLDRRYYMKKGAHVWLRVDGDRGDRVVRIGMDSFLTATAGHLNYITLSPGRTARQGRSLGSFESAKFVSRLLSPVTGRVVEVNWRVLNDPRLVNKAPYESWILAVKPENIARDLRSTDIISDAGDLKARIEEELRRMEVDK